MSAEAEVEVKRGEADRGERVSHLDRSKRSPAPPRSTFSPPKRSEIKIQRRGREISRQNKEQTGNKQGTREGNEVKDKFSTIDIDNKDELNNSSRPASQLTPSFSVHPTEERAEWLRGGGQGNNTESSWINKEVGVERKEGLSR